METVAQNAGLEAVPIDLVRASNAKCAGLVGLTIVFVGGTNGIGKNTARELFRITTRPKAYIIGRDEKRGRAACDELQEMNKNGRAVFLKRDISLIREVDELCAEVREYEPKIHCLFITAGYLSLNGRQDTGEGLDSKMAVNFYARMRLIFNLMPCLLAAAEANEIARVVSVLAAGSESKSFHPQDLDLKHNWNLHECLCHCVLMTDFMVEELAQRYPNVTFCHSFPGSVRSGITNSLTGSARLAVKVLYSLMDTWLINVKESGERHFFQITSQCYPSADHRVVGVAVPNGLSVVRGSSGQRGSGGYLLDWDCSSTGDSEVLTKYRDMLMGPKIWNHTREMLEQAAQKSRKDSKRPMADIAEGDGARSIPEPSTWQQATEFSSMILNPPWRQ